jgi:cytoskeletal protein RodZ
MQDIDQLPVKQWAEQITGAREAAKLDIASLAQALMLSRAQLRGLESGSLSPFHGPGYYLRALDKCARHLGIELDPPVTELKLSDSQITLNRVKNSPSAANLARRESNTLGEDAMPASRRGRVGMWIAAVSLILVGAGTWLAIEEGWPTRQTLPVVAESNSDRQRSTSADTSINQTEPTTSAALTEAVQAISAVQEISLPAAPTEPTALAATETITVIEQTPPEAFAAQVAVPSSEPTVSESAAPEPETKPEVETAPIANLFEATFTADCWVEIRFTDGRIEQRIYTPTQTLSLPINEIERVTFGNAQAVQASRAGKAFDVVAFTRSGNNVARMSAQDLQ